MRAQLIPLDGTPPLDIKKDMTLVGRAEDCDLRLDHKSVSKKHCIVVRTDGLLMVRDLGSTNGTRVKGQRVRRAMLMPNDELSIATYKFRVYLGPDDEPPPALNLGEHTQALDADEVRKVMRQAMKDRGMAADDDDSDSEVEVPSVQPNVLPDIYPDDARV